MNRYGGTVCKTSIEGGGMPAIGTVCKLGEEGGLWWVLGVNRYGAM